MSFSILLWVLDNGTIGFIEGSLGHFRQRSTSPPQHQEPKSYRSACRTSGRSVRILKTGLGQDGLREAVLPGSFGSLAFNGCLMKLVEPAQRPCALHVRERYRVVYQ